jgi:hypothetical protein
MNENERKFTEPSADLRIAASALWQMYVALTMEGFTEPQALEIVATVIKSNLGGSQ